MHCCSPQDLSGMARKISGVQTTSFYLPILDTFLCFKSVPFLTWRHLTSELICHREKVIHWGTELSTVSYLFWNLGETEKLTHQFQSSKAELKFFSVVFLFWVLTPNRKPLLYPLTRVSREERNLPNASGLRKQMQSSISFGMASLNSDLLAEAYSAVLWKNTWDKRDRGEAIPFPVLLVSLVLTTI